MASGYAPESNEYWVAEVTIHHEDREDYRHLATPYRSGTFFKTLQGLKKQLKERGTWLSAGAPKRTTRYFQGRMVWIETDSEGNPIEEG